MMSADRTLAITERIIRQMLRDRVRAAAIVDVERRRVDIFRAVQQHDRSRRAVQRLGQGMGTVNAEHEKAVRRNRCQPRNRRHRFAALARVMPPRLVHRRQHDPLLLPVAGRAHLTQKMREQRIVQHPVQTGRHQQSDCIRAPRRQRARYRVRLVAKRLRRVQDMFPRRVTQLVRRIVSERNRRRRYPRMPRHIAQRNPLPLPAQYPIPLSRFPYSQSGSQ